MILIDSLFAPNVPSAPSQKNCARTTSSGSIEKFGSKSRLVCERSSSMPMGKKFFGHRGREFFRRQPIAAADHAHVIAALFVKRVHTIQVERFASGPRFFRAIEHGNSPDRFGKCFEIGRA